VYGEILAREKVEEAVVSEVVLEQAGIGKGPSLIPDVLFEI
jgi:hypothetical protein